jgi:putative addiction module killer protein
MQIEVRQTEYFSKWIKSLKDRTARLRIDVRIRRLSLGNPGDVKPVGEGISELKIDYGPGYRVYFTRHNKELILLLVGGDKSTQSKDIAKAKEIATSLEYGED